MSLLDRLSRFAPGIATLAHYRRADWPSDIFAGLSVLSLFILVAHGARTSAADDNSS